MGGKQLPLPPNPDDDDFSASKTLIVFPRPLPLLRGPIEAEPAEDPSSGPYVLAFKNLRSWATAYSFCKAQVTSQCENGSRIGCSIAALNKCKPLWWKSFLGISTKEDLRARAKCEEIEMEACFVAASERCGAFAKNKCVPAFKNARIQENSLDLKSVEWKEVFRLISVLSVANKRCHGMEVLGLEESWDGFRRKSVANCVRGRDILSSDDENIENYLIK